MSCLSHSCSLVRELFNNGISGLPEALKSRDDISAMVLKINLPGKYKELSCFSGARCLSHSRARVKE